MSLLFSALTVFFPSSSVADVKNTSMPLSFSDKLADIDTSIQRIVDVTQVHPTSWLNHEKVALAFLDRAKLTGDFSDYLAAKNSLDEAFILAPPKSGPKLSRAKLHYAIHRLPLIEADLAQTESALLVSKQERQLVSEIRADVWLNTGEYAQAKQVYEKIEAYAPSVTSATRLANYYRESADYPAAERWLATAELRNGPRNPQLRSWLNLQRGILDLDRGRFSEALTHYERALKDFSGYWLIEEHIAEVHALLGNEEKAEEQYRDLIMRTQSPLFMNALSEILNGRKDAASQAEAKQWVEQSTAIYQDRLRTLPELVAGHALEHFLQVGDAEFALKLALNNHGLRPGGESALQLVQAYSLNRQIPEAVALLGSIFRSPYRSATMHATAATLYSLINEPQLVVEQQKLALSINPYAMDDVEWLREALSSAS